jgi:hypothetical protein
VFCDYLYLSAFFAVSVSFCSFFYIELVGRCRGKGFSWVFGKDYTPFNCGRRERDNFFSFSCEIGSGFFGVYLSLFIFSPFHPPVPKKMFFSRGLFLTILVLCWG